ncbi:MAG: pantoate--beta-alanine ligase [Deferribacterota bacterium]|nr:pantoate--beta-alanine ligase [Deferribacterota bacterium]
MIVLKKIDELKKTLDKLKDGSIGFVPTMGYIHEGHLSLVDKTISDSDAVVVSIFVNPLQFGAGEDFDRYPRDENRDLAILEKRNVDIVFIPDIKEMYPENFYTKVVVEKLTNKLCGKSRPGHFDGVCTVLSKFFNIINPNKAYFGLKDYQQYIIVKKMVADLNFDIEIVGMPIVREKDGLAVSSRNYYLNNKERKSALCLYNSFNVVDKYLLEGERDASKIKKYVEDFIKSHNYTKIDYVEIVNPENLEPINIISDKFLLALAVYVGGTRLIDNKIFYIQA